MLTMKIALICSFSNALVREYLDIKIPPIIHWLYKVVRGHEPYTTTDYGVWNTNAIKEFEKRNEVELHVITPCSFLKNTVQEFDINGIHYHFFRDESSTFSKMVCKQLFKPTYDEYKRNRHVVKILIDEIKPDIVQLMGAENPQYSLALLDVPKDIPTIVQLQTLLNDPDFKGNFPIDEASYQYLAKVELDVLLHADYIGTKATKFINIIKQKLKPYAIILNTSLALGESEQMSSQETCYDFVYFAADISKSCDLALEAFGLAYQQNPTISLDIVGGYTEGYKSELDAIIERHGIGDAVTFEGRLATHDDVINQIRKARFALLPLKIDLVSGTIREAMSNGLPVVTTDTGELGTQILNIDCQCALISKKSDHQALADNMIRLLNDNALAETLRQNAYKRQREKFNNEAVISGYIDAYKHVLNNREL